MDRVGKRFPGHAAGDGGFTILEVIITITIASILGTIAIQLSGSSLSMSATTVARIRNSYKLNETMEKVTRDYRIWLEEYPAAPISAFETAVRADYGIFGDPTNPVYVDGNKTGTGSSYFLDAAKDVTIDLLHLTLTDGNQSLVAVFTK